jgi:hypothetical protein
MRRSAPFIAALVVAVLTAVVASADTIVQTLEFRGVDAGRVSMHRVDRPPSRDDRSRASRLHPRSSPKRTSPGGSSPLRRPPSPGGVASLVYEDD